MDIWFAMAFNINVSAVHTSRCKRNICCFKHSKWLSFDHCQMDRSNAFDRKNHTNRNWLKMWKLQQIALIGFKSPDQFLLPMPFVKIRPIDILLCRDYECDWNWLAGCLLMRHSWETVQTAINFYFDKCNPLLLLLLWQGQKWSLFRIDCLLPFIACAPSQYNPFFQHIYFRFCALCAIRCLLIVNSSV